MQPLKCVLSLLVALSLCQLHAALARTVRVKRQDGALTLADAEDNLERDLNPINAEDVSVDDLERNKRKLPDAGFEAKNAVLGFVFGPLTPWGRFKRGLGSSSNDADTPELERTNVSAGFPPELFNKSFATLTKISKSFSELIMNSARRYSRFVLFFKPVFGDALVVKGWEDPTTTTTTTTTTKPSSLDSLNEI